MLKPTDKAPQENQETGFLATFDPDVPGYVFWLVMLGLIGFQLLVVGDNRAPRRRLAALGLSRAPTGLRGDCRAQHRMSHEKAAIDWHNSIRRGSRRGAD